MAVRSKVFKHLPKWLGIAVVLLLAIFLRVWRLNTVPAALFGDELDVGLHAYSILTTGRDYYSNHLPIIFQSFAEYRLPMQLYFAVPFIKLFGLNEWGVRLASVFFAVITILSLYFLVRRMFNKKIAIIAAALLAISPWHIMFSRQANDSGFLLPFVILGLLFFLLGLKKYSFFVVSAALFALGFYAYATSSVFIPLFVAALLLVYLKEVFAYRLQKLALIAFVALIILAPFIKSSFEGTTRERFSYLTQSSRQGIVFEVQELRRWSNSKYSSVLYNKKTVPLDRFLENYISSFSTEFLFNRGDPNPRHSTGLSGHLYRVDALLLMLGIVYLTIQYKKSRDKNYLVILLWLLIAPVPSALTADGGNHAARLILMLPPLIVLTALGFYSLTKLNGFRKVATPIVMVVILWEALRFLHGYFVIWPNTSWKHWQTGFREAIEVVVNEEEKYDKVYMDNTYEPMLQRFLFWSRYDMETFQKQFTKDVHKPNVSTGIDGFALGEKYYFGELQKPLESWIKSDILVVASAQNAVTNPDIFVNANLKLIAESHSPDGLPIFYVYTAR